MLIRLNTSGMRHRSNVLLVLALFERNVADVTLVMFDVWNWSFDLHPGQFLLLQAYFLVVLVLLSVVG